jgi:hypothetical protein
LTKTLGTSTRCPATAARRIDKNHVCASWTANGLHKENSMDLPPLTDQQKDAIALTKAFAVLERVAPPGLKKLWVQRYLKAQALKLAR